MAYIGNTLNNQNFIAAIDYFSGNGSTTSFTLSRPVASVAQVQVVIDNVPQHPSDAFSISGNTITFTSAPLSGTNNIYVYYTSPNTQVVKPGQRTVDINSFTATGTPSGSTYLRGDNTWAEIITFAAGTRLAFQQTAAPTGWTKDTAAALDDSIMRIVTGSASSGGSTAFSTFNGQTSVGATTLSTAQMPSHTHTVGGTTSATSNIGSTFMASSGTSVSSGSTGGGGSHTHSITTSIKYYDFIIASKN